MRLTSYAEGSWIKGSGDAAAILHSVTGEQVAESSSRGLDFKGMLNWGRRVGGPALRKMSIHQRALMIKALALYLMDRKEEFYELSKATGATRKDSWIDIEGGISTLFTYASKGRRELPDEVFHVEGPVERLSKENTFVGRHICVPLEGVALHINAFNFPCWGMLEKLAPTFLAGMPAIVKPATSSSYLTRAMVQAIIESNILPPGALQIICGSVGDIFEHLSCQDVVTFTGSKATGSSLKTHPTVVEHSVRFNLEADSLNCSILGVAAEPGTAEFDLFIKEVAREMTVKAGQKCTVIRRTIVPKNLEQAVIEALQSRLGKILIGDPANESVRMGPLISKSQVEDVRAQVELLKKECECVLGNSATLQLVDADPEKGAFFPHTLLRCKKSSTARIVHEVEAFGPVSTVLSYEGIDEAIEISRRGGGSLCASIFTPSDTEARSLSLGIAPFHGRILLVNEYCAKESTGHGSPLPHLVHGGPGRAGGGEELGGMRSVLHYMQRTALQGSPQRMSHISNQWTTGADLKEDRIHPFRKFYDELEIGESWLTHRRTITEADVVNFAGLSGDHFYAHLDEVAARDSIFKNRVAHGYLVLAAAAGLFVDPAPGPVIANYGIDELRFIQPVYMNDTIQVRLTCKEKTPRDDKPEGIVRWDVDIRNQIAETVAHYVILTLVSRKNS